VREFAPGVSGEVKEGVSPDGMSASVTVWAEESSRVLFSGGWEGGTVSWMSSVWVEAGAGLGD
jgi:hypothetical protein